MPKKTASEFAKEAEKHLDELKSVQESHNHDQQSIRIICDALEFLLTVLAAE